MIYLLSVGIDKYQSNKIANLNACKKDVKDLQQKLIQLKLVEPNNCQLLCDEQASRAEIIQAFRSHFSLLENGDIALFHFSGHGSFEPTDAAFIKAGIEPYPGKNETLVCFDSQSRGVFDIADKELRWLIAEVQQEKKETEFIGIFDCCHAGSMLRTGQWRSKSIASTPAPRLLSDYLEGQYHRSYLESGRLQLPAVDILSLSACAPGERALENKNGGFLTQALIEVLLKRPTLISYVDLFNEVRALVVLKSRDRQHPYLEKSGKVNPFQQFLSAKLMPDAYLPRLYQKGNRWMVQAGAIHGLGLSEVEGHKYSIYEKENTEKPIGLASIKEVFIEETEVLPEWNSWPLTKSDKLQVGIYTNTISFHLKMSESSVHQKESILSALDKLPIQWKSAASKEALFLILSKENKLLIYRYQDGLEKFLIGIEEDDFLAINCLVQQVSYLIKWEMLQQQTGLKTAWIAPESLEWSFSYWDAKGDLIGKRIGTPAEHPEAIQEIRVLYPIGAGAISYRFDIKNKHQNLNGLYFYLIHLDRKYEIKQKNEHYAKPLISGARFCLFDSREHGVGLGISDVSLSLVKDTFLLIASELPLVNPSYFDQPGFGDNMGKIISSNQFQKKKTNPTQWAGHTTNWGTKKLTVYLIRKE